MNIGTKYGIGALGILAIVVSLVAVMRFTERPPSELEIEGYLAKIGGLSVDAAEAMRQQLQRTRSDLTEMREDHPDWAAEIDAAIRGFNESEPQQTDAALTKIETLIAKRRNILRGEEAKTKRARATLVYPFDYARAEPLLCDAAALAETRFWYWIECSRVRRKLGLYPPALAATQTARSLAKAQGEARNFEVAGDDLGDLLVIEGRYEEAAKLFEEGLLTARERSKSLGTPDALRDLSVSLNKVGDAARTRGDHAAAAAAYDESLTVRRQLSDQLGTPDALRDLAVSNERVGDLHSENGDFVAAREAYERSHAIHRDLMDRIGTPDARRAIMIPLHRLIITALQTGDLPAARTYYAQAQTLIPKLHPLHIEEARAAFAQLAPHLKE